MTPEELKETLETFDYSHESSSFSGCDLIRSSGNVGNVSAWERAKRFVRESGNFCRIVNSRNTVIDCLCFSVGEWLYFVECNDGVCLRRASWDKVKFVDTKLIKIQVKEDGDPE